MGHFRTNLALILVFLSIVFPQVHGFEVDATDQVTKVIDGDTFDTSRTGKIRLADIDAPETNEPGYREATNALATMVSGKTVYLDIDDLTGQDRYGREVSVVYVMFNSTHLRNVNKALVDQGMAVVSNFTNNEFDPYSWSAYQLYSTGIAPSPDRATDPGSDSTLLGIVILVSLGILFAIFIVSRRPRSRLLG